MKKFPTNPAHIRIASFDGATIYGDGSKTQSQWLQLMPELLARARRFYGPELPQVDFYFYSKYSDYRAGQTELTGSSSFKNSWASGSGFVRNNRGYALISERGKDGSKNGIGTLMHEYGHALSMSLVQGYPMPMWLNEGFAEYFCQPWWDVSYSRHPEEIRRLASVGKVSTYRSFARALYQIPNSSYMIARLMVVEMLRGLPDTAIADILKEVERREGAYSDVIKEFCKLSPSQLHAKVLSDCGVDIADVKPKPNRTKKSPRKVYWHPWISRSSLPVMLPDCLRDLDDWKCEHYGVRHREEKIEPRLYPHWRQIALAFVKQLRTTLLSECKSNELDWINVVTRLDRNFELFTYLAVDEIEPLFEQGAPEHLSTYFSDCINQLEPVTRAKLRVRFDSHMMNFPATVFKDDGHVFLIEFGRFLQHSSSNFAEYDRWKPLSRAFLNLTRSMSSSRWNAHVTWAVEKIVTKDSGRQMVTFLSDDEVSEIETQNYPYYLRLYLRPE